MVSVVSVHHSVQGVPITHEAFDLTAQAPLPTQIPHIRHGTPPQAGLSWTDMGPLPPSRDIWRGSPGTCPNLFTWGPHSHQYWHLVTTETHVIGNQVVHTVLEFFLVIFMFQVRVDKHRGNKISFFNEEFRNFAKKKAQNREKSRFNLGKLNNNKCDGKKLRFLYLNNSC